MLRKSLRYVVIPGKPSFGSPSVEIHNRAFEFWLKLWTDVLNKISKGEKPNPDDFLRQDKISLLMRGDEVVALHAYTFFDLNQKAARSHSYFGHSYTEKAMKEMERLGARTAMSFEHFSVSPEWRSGAAGISVATTLLQLGFKTFGESQADIALGVCRVDVGVAKMCYDAGGVPLDKGLTLHGVPVDLVGILQGKQRLAKDQAENELANYFWQNREDYTELPKNQRRRKIA